MMASNQSSEFADRNFPTLSALAALLSASIVRAAVVSVVAVGIAASGFAQAPIGSEPDAQVAPLPQDPATVVAVVGQTPILWGDIQPRVDRQIESVLKKTGQQFPEAELTKARMMLARNFLVQAISTKMMREAFLLDQVGTQAAEKRQEVSAMMSSRARQMFFENEIKALIKKHDTEDLSVLDAKLRESGSSLRARQREFTDMMLGHMFMSSKVNKDPSVTIAEINARYDKDIEKYRHGSKARWEQLTALFENHPTREEAIAKINEMGREAYFGGNLQAVARDKSEEPFASDGGIHDWTSQGSLASKPLDKALFSIPLNKMSEVITDDQGYHIIRVLERKPPGVKPLHALQEDIRQEIKKEKITTAQATMLKDLKSRIPVWSMYPSDLPGAKPIRAATKVSKQNESNANRF